MLFDFSATFNTILPLKQFNLGLCTQVPQPATETQTAGSSDWRSHLLHFCSEHRSPPGLCAQPTPVNTVHCTDIKKMGSLRTTATSSVGLENNNEKKSTILWSCALKPPFLSTSAKPRSWQTPISTSVKVRLIRWTGLGSQRTCHSFVSSSCVLA